MTERERLSLVEEKLADVVRRQELTDIRMAQLLTQLAELEARLEQVNAQQERLLTLIGVSLENADLHLNLWQYPDLLYLQANSRQN